MEKGHFCYKLFTVCLLVLMAHSPLYAMEPDSLSLQDGTDVDIRKFLTPGEDLLLGFACDEGTSVNEQKTATALAEDGVEVWMPDMLGAYMLPKVRSSLSDIPDEALFEIINNAWKTSHKKIFLIASGPDTELLLRIIAEVDRVSMEKGTEPIVRGAILLFPRLNKGAPVPGQEPVYVDAVGKTRIPLLVLEGERTPNRWGIKHLETALAKGGSTVFTKIVPGVRGYFFKREDANLPEDVLTTQLAGILKASIFYLNEHGETKQ